jgi:hypothetical protein
MVISTAAAYAQFSTNVEGVRTLAGQAVTLSFWAKADTNTRNFGVFFDQNFGSGGSTAVTTTLPVASLTTGWVRYTASLTLPNISGKTIGTNDYLNIRLVYSGVGTFDTWGFQLEAGSNATAFQTSTGNPASELAACQRYLPAITYPGSSAEIGNGFNISTTQAFIQIPFLVQPRVAPTGITLSSASHFAARQANGTVQSPTSIAFNNASLSMGAILTSGNSGLVQGNGTSMQILTGSNGYILFTGCEL